MRKKEMSMEAPKGSGYAGKDSMRAKAKSAMGASMGMTKKCAKYAEGGGFGKSKDLVVVKDATRKSKHQMMDTFQKDMDDAIRNGSIAKEKKRIGAYAAGGAAKVRKGVATAKGMPIKQPMIKKGK